ncbi:MAG: hypothetical protein PHI22_03200 [Bacilli bacterium]|nr:hypothetical protein [Bacilli bacterium]MDD4298126.1 hypothetical protein [Bacilli bacterium]MDD4643629.1 hypothetical protein [Bacilli bacterium]
MRNIIKIMIVVCIVGFSIINVDALDINTYKTITNENIIYIVEHDEVFSHSLEFDKETYKDNIDFSLNLLPTSSYSSNIDTLIGQNVNHKYVFFEDQSDLPTEALITVKVSDQFNDNDKLYLYHYNEQANKLNYLDHNLIVKNGLVKFKIKHCANYVLTSSIVKNAINSPQGFSIIIIILILLGVILVAATLFINNKD